jgi:putative sugar O-methyltransferase
MTLGRDGLVQLLEEMKTAPEIYRPSAFWTELTDVGLRQLEGSGFENFKRTVNMTYFNWGVLGILRHQFVPVFSRWLAQPAPSVFRARFPNYRSKRPAAAFANKVSNFRLRVPDIASFDALSALIYRTYVAMLFEVVSREDVHGLLKSIEEPAFGNPFAIEHRDIRTSQDLCNSVHELYRSGAADARDGRPFHIAELGGGYGRLAYVCLRALPGSTYTMIDIPPALNVAQEYLTRVFPGERVFQFRPFARFDDVREEFESTRIRFLAAHQIELLPPKAFDLFVNISSLHEMSWAQIENYLKQIDRTCRGRFYTKQWRVSQAGVNGIIVRERDYPIPSGWKELFHRRHPIQRKFFEAQYQVG